VAATHREQASKQETDSPCFVLAIFGYATQVPQARTAPYQHVDDVRRIHHSEVEKGELIMAFSGVFTPVTMLQ
jgi:hypothetical protein